MGLGFFLADPHPIHGIFFGYQPEKNPSLDVSFDIHCPIVTATAPTVHWIFQVPPVLWGRLRILALPGTDYRIYGENANISSSRLAPQSTRRSARCWLNSPGRRPFEARELWFNRVLPIN